MKEYRMEQDGMGSDEMGWDGILRDGMWRTWCLIAKRAVRGT